MVTPDGERTMNTYLGAAQDLHPNDVDADTIAAAGITYLEGYLWDPPHAKEAFRKAAKIAHDARPPGRAHAVGCVLRRPLSRRVPRPDPRPARSIWCSPTRASCSASTRPTIFDTAVTALRGDAKLAVVTRSEKGCVVRQQDGQRGGAGRADRASWSMRPARATCSPRASCSGWRAAATTRPRPGSARIAAAEVIQHIGARPEVSLKELAQQNGLPV